MKGERLAVRAGAGTVIEVWRRTGNGRLNYGRLEIHTGNLGFYLALYRTIRQLEVIRVSPGKFVAGEG